MTEEQDGHVYWVMFVGLFNSDRVCVDVTGFFKDSDEPWTTSEWVRGTTTHDLFEWADDYFVRLGEGSHIELMQRVIKFTGHYDVEWNLQDASVKYDEDGDSVPVSELLDEDMEQPLAQAAERWLKELGDVNSLK